MISTELCKKIRRFNKIVIWGLKTQNHTHRYIHHHFFTVLKKLGINVVWVDDSNENENVIGNEDLVIAAGLWVQNLPIRNGVYYCLHNGPEDVHQKIDITKNIRLQVYTNPAEQASEKWDEVTFFDKGSQTLFQPWATDLLPDEFKIPVSRVLENCVFWVGSIWNNEQNQGNTNEIQILKNVLNKRNIELVWLKNISDSQNIKYVRLSRIAPAIAGRWQVEHNYLPCRMWKNISYGQLGISNVKKFDDIFKDCIVKGQGIEEIIDNALSLSLDKYRDMLFEQQQIVKKNHTYANRLLGIVRAFESI